MALLLRFAAVRTRRVEVGTCVTFQNRETSPHNAERHHSVLMQMSQLRVKFCVFVRKSGLRSRLWLGRGRQTGNYEFPPAHH
jgi:hypothetical protein